VNSKISASAIVGLAAIVSSHCALRAQPLGAPQQEPSESRSVWDGVYTEEQAKRGETLSRKQCSSCHGDTLTGGESAPPLAGGAFLANWNGLTLGDLFERVRKTMPQDAPGRLSRQESADILAYMLSVNKFPAGKAELYRQTEMLKEIRFEATRPDPKKSPKKDLALSAAPRADSADNS
jgi:S-disulfanyl-L-cysteine oxidoreductase SoxD